MVQRLTFVRPAIRWGGLNGYEYHTDSYMMLVHEKSLA